ncbi:hypothetical protein FRD01_22220 [Microvenator marinus]|uniref:Uncharacterized protein n=1 Tax=Microvenator marinus TaxID=2600177 RepID=A0A5B8XWI0_9DELT|nr:hypothetical protein [Microvenator marinus]QED29900.1 hypothetical protein FRD01_22220 [Microvenator marinus]
MILNTLGKSLLTGLVAFFSVVSIAIVGIISITYGMGQGAFSGHEFEHYMVFAMPSLIGVVPMGIAATLTSIVLTAIEAQWKYFIVPMIMPWITPIGILIGTSTLY